MPIFMRHRVRPGAHEGLFPHPISMKMVGDTITRCARRAARGGIIRFMNDGRDSAQAPSRNRLTGAALGLLVIILAGAAGYQVWTGKLAGGKQLCSICNRELHAGAGFSFRAADGAVRVVCCPRCGLHAILNGGGRALEATSFENGARIPASTAVYLEGSDIMECCETLGFRGDEATYGEI